MPNTDVRGRLAALKHHPCQARNCRNPRNQLARYCRAHLGRVERYGHPEGRVIPREDYARERTQVAAVLDAHQGHAAVETGLRIVAEMLESARANPKASPAHLCLARVAQQAVEPKTILTEAAALFVYSRRNPLALPDDDRLTFAIGRAVAYLIPQECLRVRQHRTRTRRVYKQVPKTARQGIGLALREDLAPLLVNLWQAAEELAARPSRRQRAMRSPLTPSSTTNQKDPQQ